MKDTRTQTQRLKDAEDRIRNQKIHLAHLDRHAKKNANTLKNFELIASHIYAGVLLHAASDAIEEEKAKTKQARAKAERAKAGLEKVVAMLRSLEVVAMLRSLDSESAKTAGEAGPVNLHPVLRSLCDKMLSPGFGHQFTESQRDIARVLLGQKTVHLSMDGLTPDDLIRHQEVQEASKDEDGEGNDGC